MNARKVKKIRQTVKRARPDLVEMFTALQLWPFRQRIKLAWFLIKGKKKEDPHTATMDSQGNEVKN